MLDIATTTTESLRDTLVNNFGNLFAILIPFVVGVILFMIAKKWFFGGVGRI